MGDIWVREFTGGLDTRRLFEASASNILIRARNAHISRGGEIERRYSFVPEYTLPAGTVGLAQDAIGLVVFGHTETPAGIPPGVTYQRLVHPTDDTIPIARILSFDLYRGKVYAVAEFADGLRQHYFDGQRVTDWFDGRASASFRIVSGEDVPGSPATGSFRLDSGDSGSVTSIKVDNVELLSASVDFDTDLETTALDVAAAINSNPTSPNYTAIADGTTVYISAGNDGPDSNGLAIVVTTSGNLTVDGETALSGGSLGSISAITNITVDGVPIVSAPIVWRGGTVATAAAVADAINEHLSSPEYVATSAGSQVNIIAAQPGTAANNRPVHVETADGMVVFPAAGVIMDGGSDETETFQPGTFVKTVGSQMRSVSGPNLHSSGIQEPTRWTTDVIGAGFIDLSSESSGFEELTSIERYQEFVVAFAERGIQIWFVDPDPTLARITQVLSNTGTSAPHSVTQFGDADVFYLDESGLRSLRARSSINIASTTDIGVPVDALITELLHGMSDAERQSIYGLIEPQSGRFWLIMKSTVFVFSFFQGVQISAWSTYETTDPDGNLFEVEYATVHRRRVYLRSGDTIYCYGGIATGQQYDDAEAEVWLPYFDAERPTAKKSWAGIDVACVGEWNVFAAMQPTDLEAEDFVGKVFGTTYNLDQIPFSHHSTHVSLRFRSVGTAPHRLASLVVHYTTATDET